MKTVCASRQVKGGVHPQYHKDLARDEAIRKLPLPSMVSISMSQHLGAPANPIVKKGDNVKCGQRIADAAGFISAAIHTPVSGTVKAVATAPTATGAMAPCVDIEPDGEQIWIEALDATPTWESIDGRELIAKIANAGVCGMGGAGFPTHVKLSPPADKPIDTLILNGAECEPYLTADFRLMVEQAENIWTGCRILRKILGARSVRVAIEDNKPEAIAAMERAMKDAQGDVELVVLKTEYPQGAEKQQIYAVTGREVPSGKLPMDVGAVVENVGTSLAVYDAVVHGRPLVARVTTVTGIPVKTPSNLLAPIGTRYEDLINACGGFTQSVPKVISGGPMMGFAVPSLEITSSKTTSGLLALAQSQIEQFTSMPCISCGRCVDACPMYLMPAELSQFLEAEDFASAEAWNVMDCIECGSCAFACPAHRPLVQHMRRGKGHIMLQRRQAQQKTT